MLAMRRKQVRVWIAPVLMAALVALAFYLPPYVSQWYDRQLMDEPKVTSREDQGGLADSIRLTVAEKLLRLRGGSLSFLALPGEESEIRYILEDGKGNTYISSEPVVGEDASDHEEWAARLEGVKRELLALQRAGGLPELWTADEEPELVDSSELLYIDNDTQVSFMACHMELTSPSWSLGLTVDDQSGKILSLSLRWPRESTPGWGAAGAAGFGGAWRDYWGMDSVDPGWNSSRVNEILTSALALTANSSGDYSAAGEVAFAYDGQTLRVPIYSWCSGGSCTIQWNM